MNVTTGLFRRIASLGLIISLSLVLSGCTSPRVEPVASSPSPTVEPTVKAPILKKAPPRQDFGPDGSHYPSKTPDIRKSLRGLHVVEVSASAQKIRKALDRLTRRQIDQGAVILVAPGDIPSVEPLSGFKNTRPTKVLITARDGFESVTGSGGWELAGIEGIALMRFDLQTINVKGAKNCAFGWLRINNNYFGVAASRGMPVDGVEFVEVVLPRSVVKSSDSAQIKAYKPEVLKNVLIDGSYLAPSFYRDGTYPRPHTDTLQIDGAGIRGVVTVRDTAIFASNNAATIIGDVRNVRFDRSLIVAGGVQEKRYPFKRGGAGFAGAKQGPGSNSAIQGAGGGNVVAEDSFFLGSIQPDWERVENTATNVKGKTAEKGAFTLDRKMTGWSEQKLDEIAPFPTGAYLKSIWN